LRELSFHHPLPSLPLSLFLFCLTLPRRKPELTFPFSPSLPPLTAAASSSLLPPTALSPPAPSTFSTFSSLPFSSLSRSFLSLTPPLLLSRRTGIKYYPKFTTLPSTGSGSSGSGGSSSSGSDTKAFFNVLIDGVANNCAISTGKYIASGTCAGYYLVPTDATIATAEAAEKIKGGAEFTMNTPKGKCRINEAKELNCASGNEGSVFTVVRLSSCFRPFLSLLAPRLPLPLSSSPSRPLPILTLTSLLPYRPRTPTPTSTTTPPLSSTSPPSRPARLRSSSLPPNRPSRSVSSTLSSRRRVSSRCRRGRGGQAAAEGARKKEKKGDVVFSGSRSYISVLSVSLDIIVVSLVADDVRSKAFVTCRSHRQGCRVVVSSASSASSLSSSPTFRPHRSCSPFQHPQKPSKSNTEQQELAASSFVLVDHLAFKEEGTTRVASV
jgi:hypothetical protein